MGIPHLFNCPIEGEAVSLSLCPDKLFASGSLGPGVLIHPKEGTLRSPADATVQFVFVTKHGLGLETPEGIGFLLHVGLDTHLLQGKGFTAHVKAGDRVSAGDPLLTFDPDVISAAGYSTMIPFVFCNTSPQQLHFLKMGILTPGEPLLSITPA